MNALYSGLESCIEVTTAIMSSPGADGNGLSRIQTTRSEFHVLLRLLTTHSSQGRGTERVPSNENDVEKGPSNLRDCFTLSNETNKTAGIQPKHVGVTWEDLQVVVPEANDHKVKLLSRDFLTDHPTFSNRRTSGHLTVGSPVASWVI